MDPKVPLGSADKYFNNALKHLSLGSPSLYSQVIGHSIEIIKQEALDTEGKLKRDSWKNYYALVIIADGIINDLDSTMDLTVESSRYPISLIIVHAGTEDSLDLFQ